MGWYFWVGVGGWSLQWPHGLCVPSGSHIFPEFGRGCCLSCPGFCLFAVLVLQPACESVSSPVPFHQINRSSFLWLAIQKLADIRGNVAWSRSDVEGVQGAGWDSPKERAARVGMRQAQANKAGAPGEGGQGQPTTLRVAAPPAPTRSARHSPGKATLTSAPPLPAQSTPGGAGAPGPPCPDHLTDCATLDISSALCAHSTCISGGWCWFGGSQEALFSPLLSLTEFGPAASGLSLRLPALGRQAGGCG